LAIEGDWTGAIAEWREVEADGAFWQTDGLGVLKLLARRELAHALRSVGDTAGADAAIEAVRAVNPPFADEPWEGWPLAGVPVGSPAPAANCPAAARPPARHAPGSPGWGIPGAGVCWLPCRGFIEQRRRRVGMDRRRRMADGGPGRGGAARLRQRVQA